MNLGISYVQNGFYEDALAAYQKSDELKPNNGKIIFNLGNLVKVFKLFESIKETTLTFHSIVFTHGKSFDGRTYVPQRC